MSSIPSGSLQSARQDVFALPTSPFGGGPRICIGNQFALTEAQLILATILPRYQFRLCGGAPVPEPLITLRPRGSKLLMTIHRQGG